MKGLKLSMLALLAFPILAGAAQYRGIRVIDKDIICLHFRDGEVRYRDSGEGRSAYLGHSFAEGDDTLKVFLPRYNAVTEGWEIMDSKGASWKPVALIIIPLG